MDLLVSFLEILTPPPQKTPVKISHTVLVAGLLSCVGIAPAKAATVFVQGVNAGGGWLDVNKTWVDDTQLCWAAATANVLSYTGWTGGAGLGAPADILADYTHYWQDAGGHAYYAINWWFDGNNPTQGVAGWAQLTDLTHPGFYTTDLYGSHILYDGNFTAGLEATLLGYVNGTSPMGNMGLTLSVGWYIGSTRYGGHAITLWGIDPDTDQLLFTDSDDHLTALQIYGYNADTKTIVGYGGGYTAKIEGVTGLAMKTAEDPAPTVRVVPEPAESAAILGLLALGTLLPIRRRRTLA